MTNVFPLSISVTLINRSRSTIFELDIEFHHMDHWYRYGSNINCRCGDILTTIFFLY